MEFGTGRRLPFTSVSDMSVVRCADRAFRLEVASRERKVDPSMAVRAPAYLPLKIKRTSIK